MRSVFKQSGVLPQGRKLSGLHPGLHTVRAPHPLLLVHGSLAGASKQTRHEQTRAEGNSLLASAVHSQTHSVMCRTSGDISGTLTHQHLTRSHLFIPLRALELQPFSLKPLLRRAMAYESLERYRKAYVDYKTVLQIDVSVQAAHDSVNRYCLSPAAALLTHHVRRGYIRQFMFSGQECLLLSIR